MNISIFGLGYVGCVSAGCLARNGHKIIGVDVNLNKIAQINKGEATIIEDEIDKIIKEQRNAGLISATDDFREAVLHSDVSIIAVGTPSTPKGHLNLDYIFNVIRDISTALKEKDKFHVIAIRSTVLPGTCHRIAAMVEEITGKKKNIDFAVVDNPEFLREGSAVYDYYNPPFTLIGSDCETASRMMTLLYDSLPGEIIIAEVKLAEIMKYVNNTFHALKISFANEIGNICKSMGIDSMKVMEIFCKDTQLNISPYYLRPGFAFGGSCLPKDLKGMQTLAHDLYLKTPVIDSIDKTNENQMNRAVEMLEKYQSKKIAILGLSFKAGTDDLRNSPAVALVEILKGKGFQICIYDRNIHMAKLTGKNKEYIESRIPHLEELLEEDIHVLIAKSDVIIVSTKESYFSEALRDSSGKVILDMVGINSNALKKANTYLGINW